MPPLKVMSASEAFPWFKFPNLHVVVYIYLYTTVLCSCGSIRARVFDPVIFPTLIWRLDISTFSISISWGLDSWAELICIIIVAWSYLSCRSNSRLRQYPTAGQNWLLTDQAISVCTVKSHYKKLSGTSLEFLITRYIHNKERPESSGTPTCGRLEFSSLLAWDILIALSAHDPSNYCLISW